MSNNNQITEAEKSTKIQAIMEFFKRIFNRKTDDSEINKEPFTEPDSD